MRTKIDYGIDLGTTNSAISRMENGEAIIKKTDTLKDTMPSCVYVNKKKAFQVGDSAYNALKRDKIKAMKNLNNSGSNSFIEFKRTMGTNEKYHCSNLGKDLSSEELSAEVLKTLKSFVKDENVNSIVITVPAAFQNNQKEATRDAAKMAGFSHVELIQEPIAAATAYGLQSKIKNGYLFVFDFGGGTFDAALLKVEEGIMKVIDTGGDNYLGGKNLDYAIIDDIIIPYLKENFVIDSILEDDMKRQILRDSMKSYAEETKIKLSFNDTHNILSDLGDIPGEDDEGEEFELDITITKEDLAKVLTPLFQKAIDLSKALLEKNNLKNSELEALILVGGPTFSPIVRKMLKEQICEPDTSADPMTVVSEGAALYASTIAVSEEVREQTRDKTKIQLDLKYDAETVEEELMVVIKTLADKTEGEIPEKILAELTRGDNAWSSGKIEINEIGDIFDVQLEEGKMNVFNIALYDDQGNILESEPSSINIKQGSIGARATLAYNIGIELRSKALERNIFKTIKGLERNKEIDPIKGIAGKMDDLKTPYVIKPGIESDILKIPIFEGRDGADGTRAMYNEHVTDVIISGADLPNLLPEKSEVNLKVKYDRSEKITVEAFFPYLDFTFEATVEKKNKDIKTAWLASEIEKAKDEFDQLKEEGNTDNTQLKKIESELGQIEKSFENNKEDLDNKAEVLRDLRLSLKSIDAINDASEWPKLEEKLKEDFYRLEKAESDLGDDKTKAIVSELRNQLEKVLENENVKDGNVLLTEINAFYFHLTFIYQLINWIRHHNENFDDFDWKDETKARSLINEGLQIIGENPTKDRLHPLVIAAINLLPKDNRKDSPIPEDGLLTD